MPGASGHPDLAAASEPIASGTASQPSGRTLERVKGGLAGQIAIATYLLKEGASAGVSGAAIAQAYSFINLIAADFVVVDKTPKLRLRVSVATNATPPVADFTFGLYPITVSGGTNANIITLGVVTPGSTAVVSAPAANSVVSADSGDFNVPADGAYALGFTVSAQTALNSSELFIASLHLRHV
jgi:hypothetical protein